MNNADQEKQEERVNPVSEDSNVMTIEFLRARLQSERSISKSARQRADELAQRVAELEEQLRIVTLQRQRAEEATENVLNILKNNGLSNASGGSIDSQVKEDTEDHLEKQDSELSCSENESSPQTVGSLSWNSCKDTGTSAEKNNNPMHGRSGSVSSLTLSTRQRTGKSCRQIRRNDLRCHSDAGINTFSMELKDTVDAEASILLETDGNDGEVGKGLVRYTDMEMAIMQRQQLIGQYEAMERAQRDWEEKFNESNCVTPDSCDNGNRSDITEETNEIRIKNNDAADNHKEEFSFPMKKPEGTAETANTSDPVSQLSLTLHEQKNSEEVKDILEALNQAKLSLKRKIENSQTVCVSSPPRVSSFFRLPSDFLLEERNLALMGSNYPPRTVPVISDDQNSSSKSSTDLLSGKMSSSRYNFMAGYESPASGYASGSNLSSRYHFSSQNSSPVIGVHPTDKLTYGFTSPNMLK